MTKKGVALPLKKKRLLNIFSKIKRHWLLILLIICGLLIQSCIIYQFLYPSSRLLPYARIDGINLGGWKKDEAIVILDRLYANSKVSIHFGKSEKPYISPRLDEIGLTVSNSSRIKAEIYPWYLRIVPSSILWAQYLIYNKDDPTYKRDKDVLDAYVKDKFGENCEVEPINATLEVSGPNLNVIPSINGGDCDTENVVSSLTKIKPHLDDIKVSIGNDSKKPDISDNDAKQFGESLKSKIGSGVDIVVKDTTIKIPSNQVLSWIDFNTEVGKLTYSLNATKASQYLSQEIAPDVEVSPGITTITTFDFVEVSRTNGSDGIGLNVIETLNSIRYAIENSTNARAIIMSIPSRIIYFRTYSSTDNGLTALLQQYAESHPGISSVSVIELSGSRRRASYNSDDVLVSASTYKLFVAYSTLKRIESGHWSWSDHIIDDRDLATCFDDMIVQSDNDCAESIAERAGWQSINNEAYDIGCTNTSLTNNDGYARTSSADLSLFLAQLQTGQILNQQSSRDLLINAMKRNVYREGIPSGVSGEVANKVGFIAGVLNDAAIVYTPTGTYVLVIMTDGSNWETIADFASEINAVLSN